MADKKLAPLAFGDSLAEGLITNNKLEGSARTGAGPREVLDKIKAYALDHSLEGRDVFIGTGIPNIPEQRKFIDEQVDFVRQKGGNPILIGVGPGTKSRPTTGQNEYLAELAKRKGLFYMGPLINMFPDVVKDPMGLHLRGPQYKQIVQQFSGAANQAPPPPKKEVIPPRQEVAPPVTRERPPEQTSRNQGPPPAAPAGDLLSQFTGAVLQAESTGKRYDKSGKLLTSSAGALGEMQVMPGTITDPGFGVRPAKNNSPEEIARVGRDYAAVMLKRYNNDPSIAAVAYNWGPGNTDRWLRAGASFEALPVETQKYVTRITNQMGAPITMRRAPSKVKRVDNAPPVKKVEVQEYKPGSTLESGPRIAQQPQEQTQVTRADVERLGPNYQAALAAMTLGDTREDNEDEDSIAEQYRAKQEDEQRTEDIFSAPQRIAGLDLSYQSPFGEEQPVMMAEGGEAKSMLRRLYENAVPAQVRTFAETALMPEEKRAAATITEQNFTDEEQRQILDTIVNARKRRMEERGLTTVTDPAVAAQAKKQLKKALNLSPASIKDLEESQKNKKIEDKYFLSGKGAVFYGDYPNAYTGKVGAPVQNLRDSTIGREGAIRNTLGRFVYETTPEGKIRIKDNYEFADDLVQEMNQRPSAAYQSMSTPQKVNALLMDTLHNKQDALLGSGMKVGRATFPSRVGSAFIGEKGRPVDVTIDPRELMPGYAGYAHGGVVHRAEGSPIYGEGFDTGPITADTRKAFANRQSFNPREALAALKRLGIEGVSNLESLARGSVAGVPGVVGDIESLFRDDKARRFATSEEVERQYLPKRLTAPTRESQGFVEIGTAIDPSIALKAAKPTAKAALEAMKASGPQIESALMKAAPTAQPMYAVKPKGGVFFPPEFGSNMDNYLEDVAEKVLRYSPNIPGKDARKIRDLILDKGRKYLTTTYATGSDPIREAILEGRLTDVTFGSRYSERALSPRLIARAREGDPRALKVFEQIYDDATNLHGNIIFPTNIKDFDKTYKVAQLEKEKMLKEGVPKEFQNISLIEKSLDELNAPYSSQASKTLAAFIEGKAKSIPSEVRPLLTAVQGRPFLGKLPEPIYDMFSYGPKMDILSPDISARGIATLTAKDIEKMSFPEMIIRGAKNTLFERSQDAIIRAIDNGKKVPDKFFKEGVTSIPQLENTGWVRLESPFSTRVEGAAMHHSVGGYGFPGNYGAGGSEALLSGEVKIYSLRPQANKPVVTVEARMTPDGLYIADVRSKFNSVPTEEENKKIFELFDLIQPKTFGVKIYHSTREGDRIAGNKPIRDWGRMYSDYLKYRNKGAE